MRMEELKALPPNVKKYDPEKELFIKFSEDQWFKDSEFAKDFPEFPTSRKYIIKPGEEAQL